MIRFLMQKLLHKKWMVVSLLIGNVLLIAIACSNPMYKMLLCREHLQNHLVIILKKREFIREL